ncbi:SDR family NAD(P)-dependent oxidoreductase [Amycolatopsis anabasis]|uniref:SDR family NAD(P)-dependent oxidoreductase n=1 Tax=Amycolatopsis anabasis TaxID=1840409 RepID=UPI00131A6F0D|nr:SDR family NAD(P)-dependent oxidoreductase [Amycolatopsis anabasis]
MADSKVALVTGAGRGIGAAIARELHGRGTRVALLDRDDASGFAAELDASGETAFAVTADVRAPEELRSAVHEIAERWHSPDILVNNAARTAQKSVWDIECDEWDAVLETNLRSVFAAIRLCAPAMRERGWGRIVNLASLAGQQGGLVAGAHYASSKAGILVLTKIFARELAPYDVTVNAVAPGPVRTPVMDDMDAGELRRAMSAIPVGRFGRPEEVAAIVGHLCGDEAGFITGSTVDINGGVFMR